MGMCGPSKEEARKTRRAQKERDREAKALEKKKQEAAGEEGAFANAAPAAVEPEPELPASVRDRVDALLGMCGITATGNLGDDVRAIAGNIGVEWTNLKQTLEACEAQLGV
mmetsp:Transcript_33764/g.101989  ORF Transcript_33764/g.101989 Transcript_33764/m.101989 type:complete len:111 (+) Transcript_33764:34-366(+)